MMRASLCLILLLLGACATSQPTRPLVREETRAEVSADANAWHTLTPPSSAEFVGVEYPMRDRTIQRALAGDVDGFRSDGGRAMRLPRQALGIARHDDGLDETLIAWHSKHRVLLELPCDLPVAFEVEHLRCAPLRRDPANTAALARYRELRTLDLREVALTEAMLVSIASLPKLESLYLGPSAVQRDVVVARLPKLVHLDMGRMDMTSRSASAAALATQTELEELSLRNNFIEDVSFLAKLTRLRALNLSVTRVTDAAIPTLVALPELHTLNLDGTQVTMQGLRALGASKSLRFLYIKAVGPEARKELERALPGCTIREITYPDEPEA